MVKSLAITVSYAAIFIHADIEVLIIKTLI